MYDKFNEAPLIILLASFLNKNRIRSDIFIFIIFINHYINSKHHVIKEWKKKQLLQVLILSVSSVCCINLARNQIGHLTHSCPTWLITGMIIERIIFYLELLLLIITKPQIIFDDYTITHMVFLPKQTFEPHLFLKCYIDKYILYHKVIQRTKHCDPNRTCTYIKFFFS